MRIHSLDRQVAALEANGHPVARLDLQDKSDLGQEFFRWEFAVAAAGAALGIHPFNQPDVQLAKDLAKKAMSEPADKGTGKAKDTVSVADREALRKAAESWIGKKKARDYVAVQAYIDPSVENAAKLQTLRAVDPAAPERCNDTRLRPAFSPLHRTTAQGRPELGVGVTDCRPTYR